MKDIIIRNEQELKIKINNIKQEGINCLHLVADFDRTITKAHHIDNKVFTSSGILIEGNYISEEFNKEARNLFSTYRPNEISKELSLKEKSLKMHEWWTKTLQLFIDHKLNKNLLKEIIEKYSS
ncbi:MAG TPA: hypothetical protein VJI68_02610 [Candidatus Nanoarchaeia archaeon]|nr:hypothetical protein [Candidatus Nanoarchaeia archaeon]